MLMDGEWASAGRYRHPDERLPKMLLACKKSLQKSTAIAFLCHCTIENKLHLVQREHSPFLEIKEPAVFNLTAH